MARPGAAKSKGLVTITFNVRVAGGIWETKGLTRLPADVLSVVVFHRDNDIALLVALIDVPMGIGHLLERVAPIDDRFEVSGFN